METMYDRLGDLLSQTLDEGHVKFVKLEHDQPQTETKNNTVENKSSGNSASEKQGVNPDAKKNISGKKHSQKKVEILKPVIIKKLSPEMERAYRLLGLSYDATVEDVKKAYKEKLLYYHPDKHTKNEILQKVATDKTRQVIESYNLILSAITTGEK